MSLGKSWRKLQRGWETSVNSTHATNFDINSEVTIVDYNIIAGNGQQRNNNQPQESGLQKEKVNLLWLRRIVKKSHRNQPKGENEIVVTDRPVITDKKLRREAKKQVAKQKKK